MTALDARQMRDGDPGSLGDGFLGHPLLVPYLPDRGAESGLRIPRSAHHGDYRFRSRRGNLRLNRGTCELVVVALASEPH